MEVYRNRLLKEYHRDELEELFLRKNEQLDEQAKELEELEAKNEKLYGKLTRLKQDITDPTKQQVKFNGSMAPTAYKQSAYTVKELQGQIDELEINIIRQKKVRDEIKREVQYFQSLLVYPNKNHNKNKTSKGLISIEDLIAMLAEISSKNTDPLIVNRIAASIYILRNNLPKAELPMRKIMELIGESNLPLFDYIDAQKEIVDRDEKIEDLNRRIAELSEQQRNMDNIHSENVKKYAEESEENQRKLKEKMDLTAQKEALEVDALKLGVVQTSLDALVNQLEQMKKQNADTEKFYKDQADDIKSKGEKDYYRLQQELNDLLKIIDELKSTTSENESRVNEYFRQHQAKGQQIAELTELLNKKQKENTELMKVFAKRMSHITEGDPFQNESFVQFLKEMDKDAVISTGKDKRERIRLQYDTVSKCVKDIQKLTDALGRANEKLEKYSQKKYQLKEEYKTMTTSAAQRGSQSNKRPQKKQLNFQIDDKITLGEDETAILITIQDYQISREILGKQKCKVMLSLEFLDYETYSTNPSDDLAGDFDITFCYPFKNTPQLKQILEKHRLRIVLVRSAGMMASEVAEGFILFQPFVDGQTKYESTFVLTSIGVDKRAVGTVKFQAEIAVSLVD